VVNGAMQRTIEATSKENYYSKQCVNYFQSWHMGTTNKLLHTALQKQSDSSRQPEAAVVTCRRTVGKWPGRLDPTIITKLFKKCSISNDLDTTESDVLWVEQYDKSDTDSDEEGEEMYDDTRTDTTDVQ